MMQTLLIQVRPLGNKYLAEVKREKPHSQMQRDPYYEILGSALESTKEAALAKAIREAGLV